MLPDSEEKLLRGCTDIVSSFQNIRPSLTDVSLPSLGIEMYTDDSSFIKEGQEVWGAVVTLEVMLWQKPSCQHLCTKDRIALTKALRKSIFSMTVAIHLPHSTCIRVFLNTEDKSIKNKRFLISWKLFWPKEGLSNELPQTPGDGESTKFLRNHKVDTKWQKKQPRYCQHQRYPYCQHQPFQKCPFILLRMMFFSKSCPRGQLNRDGGTLQMGRCFYPRFWEGV